MYHSEDRERDLKGLFDRYYSRLVYFSFQMIGDKAAAEDIVQDIFVRYWNSCDQFSVSAESVKSYFYTSVRNASLNAVRHIKIKERYVNLGHPEPEDKGVMHRIIRSEVLAELYAAINSLPEACREISLRSYIDEKKNHEIAEELGISINTVKTQKQRALKLLRLRLSPELYLLLVLAVSC